MVAGLDDDSEERSDGAAGAVGVVAGTQNREAGTRGGGLCAAGVRARPAARQVRGPGAAPKARPPTGAPTPARPQPCKLWGGGREGRRHTVHKEDSANYSQPRPSDVRS
eukprot:364089-Chlamydomonas_euryale.AAC.17